MTDAAIKKFIAREIEAQLSAMLKTLNESVERLAQAQQETIKDMHALILETAEIRRALGVDPARAELDPNLYGAFPVKSCFWFVAGSLFGAGKAVPRPVACDQVRGARGWGQGTETLAKLVGLPPSGACVSQRLEA
jgi:hypothetical protein